MSISTKLYAIFSLLATVTIAVAAVAAINSRQHADLTKKSEVAFARALDGERVKALLDAIEGKSIGIYAAADMAGANTFATGLIRDNDRLSEILAEWQQLVSPDEATQFDALAGRIKQYQESRRELVRRAMADGPAAAREWSESGTNRGLRDDINKLLEPFNQAYSHRWKRAHAKIDGGIDTTAWLLSFIVMCAVLLAGIGMMLIRRAVAQPLERIARVTELVASGTTGVEIPYRERGDEVGALARSIAVFQDAMRQNEELNNTVIDDAQARARRQEQMSTEILMFSADMEATLSELGRISDQMLGASRELSVAADTAASRTSGATTASSEASENVRDIASAADELSASVSEIDRQVAQSNSIATKAVTEAERTNATVKELNEAAGRIGDVVKLITDIAEQTNLLALNATIEAARAGDAGRGFAVVANEVKALSGQTAKATEDIRAQISGMQHATMRSIEAIGAIERTIREIGDISGAIAAAVTEQGAATQEIARSVETAAKRTIDTADEVVLVGEATAATRNNADAVKIVAEDLGSVAARIRGQVDHFFQELRAA
ncbi:MAG: methyl-accepting chemotaxis protein [Xanthobacteraceae bacterium]